MRVIVCGGRGYSDRDNLFHTMDMIHDLALGDLEVATGDAKGADTLASEWAYRLNDSVEPSKIYRAEWGKYGDAAGPIRNAHMLVDFKPDMVVAFPGGMGTADMVAKAKAAGVTVILVGKSFPL